jgi:transposase InsO family protein
LRTRVFSYFGLPKIFHSDNGTEFKNQFVKLLIDEWPGNCKIDHGKPRCPWVQGKVEQSNGTLQRILTSKLAELETDNWVDLLPDVMYVMNINLQNSTKTTPYNIMFG